MIDNFAMIHIDIIMQLGPIIILFCELTISLSIVIVMSLVNFADFYFE